MDSGRDPLAHRSCLATPTTCTSARRRRGGGGGGLAPLHRRNHPILTDSGGFQVMSLQSTLKLDEDGVSFKSIYDGSSHRWTPEDNMRIQEQLGADDHAARPVPPIRRSRLRGPRHGAPLQLGKALPGARTSPSPTRRSLYVQGGTPLDPAAGKRGSSARHGTGADRPPDGLASEGRGYSVASPTTSCLRRSTGGISPSGQPTALPDGRGQPHHPWSRPGRGVDLFDCVLPTRTARMKTAFSSQGRLNL